MLSNPADGHARQDELLPIVQEYYRQELQVISSANQHLGAFMRSLIPDFMFQSVITTLHFSDGSCFLGNELLLDSVHSIKANGIRELWAATIKCYVPPPDQEVHGSLAESWFVESCGTIDQDQMLESYLLIHELNRNHEAIYAKWLELNTELRMELALAHLAWKDIHRVIAEHNH